MSVWPARAGIGDAVMAQVGGQGLTSTTLVAL